jgi:hypothetical protein
MPLTSPNFFILGAPKCGTTSVNDWLAGHPDVFMARKECHFWATDLGPRGISTAADYRRLFESASGERVIGEASVWNLYSEDAVPQIERTFAGARYLVMIRNPVDLVYSLYAQLRFSSDEDARTFGEAWDLEGRRRAGYDLPPLLQNPKQIFYREVGRLGSQLERLIAVVGSERVLVRCMDDLRDASTLRETISGFLGIDSMLFSTNIPSSNSNKESRSAVVSRAIHHPPPWALASMRRAKRITSRESFALIERVRDANKVSRHRPPLEPKFRQELEHFSPEVEMIERLTGRDFSSWKSVT